MDPFWHHNRYWMERTRRPMGRDTIMALTVGVAFALISLFYASTGREGSAMLYAAIGLGIMLISAWKIRR